MAADDHWDPRGVAEQRRRDTHVGYGVSRVLDLTATEAARAALAIGDRSVEPQRSICRAYSFTKSRIDGLTPAGQATVLVYATEAFEYEREIRPGSAISARSLQQFSTALGQLRSGWQTSRGD